MLRDWHALRLIRRGGRVHLFTDPACRFHHAPRPGSRLDRASRGVSCPICMETRSVCNVLSHHAELPVRRAEVEALRTALKVVHQERDHYREALETIAGATTIADAVPEVRAFARDAVAVPGEKPPGRFWIGRCAIHESERDDTCRACALASDPLSATAPDQHERSVALAAEMASRLGLRTMSTLEADVWGEVNAMPTIERCGSCGGVINPQTGECRCSD